MIQAHLKQALSLAGKTGGHLNAAVNRLVTKQISAAARASSENRFHRELSVGLHE